MDGLNARRNGINRQCCCHRSVYAVVPCHVSSLMPNFAEIIMHSSHPLISPIREIEDFLLYRGSYKSELRQLK